ncbi:oligopeptide transport ATP-binding protein OppD [Clostridia bacterium]|nr:oligopeptide transport ATP-binding protein OppD [Clostridia bacterium]
MGNNTVNTIMKDNMTTNNVVNTTTNTVTNTQRNSILSVKDLHVSFSTYGGTVNAVRGVSFDLKHGETLAIVGESGSGKSVSSKAVMGLLSKNASIPSGEIHYDGSNLLKLTDKEFSKIRGSKISMIFQDPMLSLNPVMKVGKQITEMLFLSGKIKKKDAIAKAAQLMKAVGIEDAEKRFHQYPFQFSGGMRQRIVIACALAGEPEILICDEPTTALDVSVQAQILDLISDIQKKRNLSVIFITHDLGVVAGIADRIAVMYAGKIVEIGTCDEIFYDPRHPYTIKLLAAMPDMDMDGSEELISIPGAPPDMLYPPKGDAFAARNDQALKIDFEKEPPMFPISETHFAATWLLHPYAPKVELPPSLQKRINKAKTESKKG